MKHKALEAVEFVVESIKAGAPGSTVVDAVIKVAGGFGVGGLVRSALATMKPSPETEARDEASANLAAYGFRCLGPDWLKSEISRAVEYQAAPRPLRMRDGDRMAQPGASIFGDITAAAVNRNAAREAERVADVETRRDAVVHAVWSYVTRTAGERGELVANVDDRGYSALLERLFAMVQSCAINAEANRLRSRMPSRVAQAALEVRACEAAGRALDRMNAALLPDIDGGYVPEYESADQAGRTDAEADRHFAEDEAQAAEVRARTGW